MRSHEEHREELAAMERRCVLLVSEGEETHAALESAERARKAMETELQDACEKYSDLSNQVLPPLLLESSSRINSIAQKITILLHSVVMATVVLIVEGDPMWAKISLLYAVNSVSV